MKQVVKIVHNPKAGTGDFHKKEVTDIVERMGMSYEYISTEEEDWENFLKTKTDMVFLAGGDGTLCKLAKILLKNQVSALSIPIILIPAGTANNIAKTLGIPKRSEPSIKLEGNDINFDCGRVLGLPDHDYFLESFGVGLFPQLMLETKNRDIQKDSPSEEMRLARKLLLKISVTYKAKQAEVIADGTSFKGSFLLIEIMNIQFIGPNLKLAPNADPSDGYLEVVMLHEEDRDEFVAYLEKSINGESENNGADRFLKILRAKKIKVVWGGKTAHVDDRVIENYSHTGCTLEMSDQSLEFMT